MLKVMNEAIERRCPHRICEILTSVQAHMLPGVLKEKGNRKRSKVRNDTGINTEALIKTVIN